MKTIRFYMQTAAAILLVAGGAIFTGCGEDDPVTPPDYGESAVTFIHVNPGLDGRVAFFRSDTIQITSTTPSFGEFFNATTPNGPSTKYLVKSVGGTNLKSATAAQDTAKETMVVFTGNADTNELFFASSTKGAVGTSAAVRFIHAAKDAGPRDLRIGTPGGAAVASNLAYKGVSGSYISVVTTTDTLWIVDPANAANNIGIPVNLTPTQGYSIVFAGSKTAVLPELKWQGIIVADPN